MQAEEQCKLSEPCALAHYGIRQYFLHVMFDLMCVSLQWCVG